MRTLPIFSNSELIWGHPEIPRTPDIDEVWPKKQPTGQINQFFAVFPNRLDGKIHSESSIWSFQLLLTLFSSCRLIWDYAWSLGALGMGAVWLQRLVSKSTMSGQRPGPRPSRTHFPCCKAQMVDAGNHVLDFWLLVDLGPRWTLEGTWHRCGYALKLHNQWTIESVSFYKETLTGNETK